MRNEKVSNHLKLTPMAMALIDELKKVTGASKTSILEIAIRRFAANEGVDVAKVEELIVQGK